MKRALLPVLPALAVSACVGMESRAGQRDPAPLTRIDASPLRADLPETDEPPRPRNLVNTPRDRRPPRPRIAGSDRVSLQLRDLALGEAVGIIAEMAGVNIYLDAGLDVPVDASFPSVTLDDALHAILARNGLALVEDPPGIFWVTLADGTQETLARFPLRSIRAADIEADLVALVGGDSKVIVDEGQNLVVVRGREDDVQAVSDYLAAADRLKPQVLIEAAIFEASLSDRFDLGIASAFQDRIGGNTVSVLEALATPGDGFQMTLDLENGNLTSTINALRQFVGIELVSSPQVLAITNTQATIAVTEEVPYVNVTSTNDAGGGSSVVQEVLFKRVGIELTVTPTIQESGVIEISIDQELSEVVDFFQNIPVVDSRHLLSRFLVEDRETIVLGGLIQDRRSDLDTGVPILMHVPLLGRLFRSDEDTTEKRELLVFLTPRVLDPSEAARLAPLLSERWESGRGEMWEHAGDYNVDLGGAAR